LVLVGDVRAGTSNANTDKSWRQDIIIFTKGEEFTSLRSLAELVALFKGHWILTRFGVGGPEQSIVTAFTVF